MMRLMRQFSSRKGTLIMFRCHKFGICISGIFFLLGFYDKGHQKGFQDGKGLQEGRQLGLLKGCQVGGDRGLYTCPCVVANQFLMLKNAVTKETIYIENISRGNR